MQTPVVLALVVDVYRKLTLVGELLALNLPLFSVHFVRSLNSASNDPSLMAHLLLFSVLQVILIVLELHLSVEVSFVDPLEVSAHPQNLRIRLEDIRKVRQFPFDLLLVEGVRMLVLFMRGLLLEDLPRGLEEHKLCLELALQFCDILVIESYLIVIAVQLFLPLDLAVFEEGLQGLQRA